MVLIYSNTMTDCLYPSLCSQSRAEGSEDGRANDFRLQKIDNVRASLTNAIQQSEKVRKKYSRVCAILRSTAMISGSISIVLGASGLATSLSGLGIIVGIPLGGLGGLMGLLSVSASAVSKRFGIKQSKHAETVALARAKLNSISDLVSKALNDNKVDEHEFALILAELEKFESMRLAIRRKTNEKNISDLRQQLRLEIAEEFVRKVA